MTTPPRNIILVGFMASGKTSVGRALAAAVGWPLADADAEIVARAQKPIHQIFADHGEPAFRRLERQVIARLCAAKGQIIASGGGAFADPQNRRAMLSGGPSIPPVNPTPNHPPPHPPARRRQPHPPPISRTRPGPAHNRTPNPTRPHLRPSPPHHRNRRVDTG